MLQCERWAIHMVKFYEVPPPHPEEATFSREPGRRRNKLGLLTLSLSQHPHSVGRLPVGPGLWLGGPSGIQVI